MPKPWIQPIERALLNAAQVADGEEVPQELAHALLELEQRVEALVTAADALVQAPRYREKLEARQVPPGDGAFIAWSRLGPVFTALAPFREVAHG